MNLRRSAILILALLSLPLLSACVRVLNPTGWSPVVFDGDVAYITTSKGHLSAVEIDGESGTALWTFPDKDRDEDKAFKAKAIYGAPVVDGDRIYLTTFEAGVVALNKADGRPIWPTAKPNASRIDGDLAGGLVLAGDNLYFGTTEGRVYGWKKADGTPAPGWETPKEVKGGIWSAPVVDGDGLFVATMDGSVHGFSLSNGSELWSPFKATGAIADLGLIHDGLLFVPSINRHVYLIRTADGSVEGDFRASDWVWTGAATTDGTLVFGDFSGDVYALDITNLSTVWKASVEGERIRSGAAIIGDVVVVADRKPVVSFFSASTGELLNRVPIENAGTIRADLTVHDGAVYISTTDGKLFRAQPENRSVVQIALSGVKK